MPSACWHGCPLHPASPDRQRHGQRSVPRAPLLSMADRSVACGIEAAVCGGVNPVNVFVLALRGALAAVARDLARVRDTASVDGVLGHGEAYPYALTRGRPTAVAPWPAVSRRRLEAEKSWTRPCHDPGTRLRMLCNLNPRNLPHTLPPLGALEQTKTGGQVYFRTFDADLDSSEIRVSQASPHYNIYIPSLNSPGSQSSHLSTQPPPIITPSHRSSSTTHFLSSDSNTVIGT